MAAAITDITAQVFPYAPTIEAVRRVQYGQVFVFDAAPGVTLEIDYTDAYEGLNGFALSRLFEQGESYSRTSLVVSAERAGAHAIRWVVRSPRAGVEEASAHMFDAAVGSALALLLA